MIVFVVFEPTEVGAPVAYSFVSPETFEEVKKTVAWSMLVPDKPYSHEEVVELLKSYPGAK